MKLIVAIIKPFKLEDVRDALVNIGVRGMTITEVKGFGRQKGHTEIYRGAEYTVNIVPKIRIDVAVDSAEADRVVETIIRRRRPARSGTANFHLARSNGRVRIRTGETDMDASLGSVRPIACPGRWASRSTTISAYD